MPAATVHLPSARASSPEASTPEPPPPVPWRWLLLATGVGLALRVAWWWIAEPGPISDFMGYRALATRMVEEGTYVRDGVPTAWRAPGYPSFLAVGIWIWDSDRWLSFLNVLASASVVPLTGLLAHRLRLPRRAVIGAALAAAVMPPLALWAPVLGSENLQLPLVLAALVLATTATPTRWALVASGVTFGLAVLVRPESLFYLLTVPVFLWSAGSARRPALARSALVVATAAAVVAPWYVRNEVVLGRGTGLSTTGGFNFYLAHNPDTYGFVEPEDTPLDTRSERALTTSGYEQALDHLRDEPAALLGDIREGTRALYEAPWYAAYYSTRAREGSPEPRTVTAEVFDAARGYARTWSLFAVVALVGLVSLRRSPRALAALGAVLVANWLCFAVVFWAMPRYRLPIEPILCVAIGAAVGLPWARGRPPAVVGERDAAGDAPAGDAPDVIDLREGVGVRSPLGASARPDAGQPSTGSSAAANTAMTSRP